MTSRAGNRALLPRGKNRLTHLYYPLPGLAVNAGCGLENLDYIQFFQLELGKLAPGYVELIHTNVLTAPLKCLLKIRAGSCCCWLIMPPTCLISESVLALNGFTGLACAASLGTLFHLSTIHCVKSMVLHLLTRGDSLKLKKASYITYKRKLL